MYNKEVTNTGQMIMSKSNRDKKIEEIQGLTNIPEDITDDIYEEIMRDTTWGISHQVLDFSYERVNIKVSKVSKIPSTDLQIGDTFSFFNPETTKDFYIYRVKRHENYHCLVFKIN